MPVIPARILARFLKSIFCVYHVLVVQEEMYELRNDLHCHVSMRARYVHVFFFKVPPTFFPPVCLSYMYDVATQPYLKYSMYICVI